MYGTPIVFVHYMYIKFISKMSYEFSKMYVKLDRQRSGNYASIRADWQTLG